MTNTALLINDEAGRSTPPASELQAAARAAIDSGPRSGVLLDSTEVSITLVSVDRIRELNREFHGIDTETDVLAFPLSGAPDLLGDAYVCPEVAERSAREHGIPAEEEILRLVIHAVLHLLGHEHPDGDERYESEMFTLQEALLAAVLDRA